ncbi:MAG: RagB/SusD family nutrient uptake outer membrane protein [Bacteroidota bacterium]
MNNNKRYFLFLMTLSLFSCTKLDESFRSDLAESNNNDIKASQLLLGAYNSIAGPFQGNADLWALQTLSTDEGIPPTRAGDWDDNGAWRAVSSKTWNADLAQVRGQFEQLLATQFSASNVLQYNPSAQEAAEARFIRALSMYWTVDGYDQVPYREDLQDYKLLPITLKGMEAVDFIISELTAIMNDLPATGPAYTASKNAAKALLMKIYLNKGVYANRATPTFAAEDMNKVVALADEIVASGRYSLSSNYFDNFSPDNHLKSTENILTFLNDPAANRGGNVRGFAFMVQHYNQNPSGWNGFATLSDFYDKFEATDQRRGVAYSYPGGPANPGKRVNVGFMLGQQYDLVTDAPLKARNPADKPLVFTRDVKLVETDPATLELTGIRPNKYAYDYGTPGDQKNNDFAVFRLADVLLMKAEALLRTSNAAAGLTLVNSIRQKRGAADLATLTLDNLLDERGRELYWEGYRRQDQIRFGKYLLAYQNKPAAPAHTLIFPIPSSQIAVNPNLTQNPGY